MLHAKGGLDVARRYSSTFQRLRYRALSIFLGGLLGTKKGGDQDHSTGFELTHRQRVQHLIVRLGTHPIRFFVGLGQDDEVVTHTEWLARAEVGAALTCPVLLEQAIDAPAEQLPQQKIDRVEGVL